MSDLNEESVRNLCRLCRIEVKEEELGRLYNDLNKILDYVELLSQVDVSECGNYNHTMQQGIDRLREDEVKETLPNKVFLDNAPDQVGGMIRVPTVIAHDV